MISHYNAMIIWWISLQPVALEEWRSGKLPPTNVAQVWLTAGVLFLALLQGFFRAFSGGSSVSSQFQFLHENQLRLMWLPPYNYCKFISFFIYLALICFLQEYHILTDLCACFLLKVRFKGPLTYLKSADQRYTPTRPLQEDSDASWAMLVDG